MEKSLAQEQIDALFKSAKSAAQSAQPEADANVRPYNYSRAGQISREQLRSISSLNDLFARNLGINLGAWLGMQCRIQLVSAEQIPFEEFVMRGADLSFIASLRLEPLRAVAILQMELAPVPSMIDALLGGIGQPGEVRELTSIEEAIVAHVVELICRELSSAWQSIGLSFYFESRQMQTQMARLLPIKERALCLSFEIRLPSASGLLHIALPAVVSNTVLRSLRGDLHPQKEHSNETRERMRGLVKRVSIGTALQLAPVRIPMRDLDGLEPGQVVVFPVTAKTRPELLVAGVPLFQAVPVRSAERRAAHIEGLPPE
jgi:flagellar motor switch protein FliM